MRLCFFRNLKILTGQLCAFASSCLFGVWFLISPATAAVLTADLEIHLLQNVSTSWQTVPLANSYISAIPICTYNLQSFSGANPNYNFPPAVVRIRNISANSFDVRIQGWEDGPAVAGDVHCIVTDTGAHTLPDGRKYEAYTVLSDKTSGRYSTDGAWNQGLLENVSASIVNTYTNHVVLGQVISFNDSRASVFNTSDCESRQSEPYNAGHADGICVGKHIGQIAGSRNTETIGYLVAEAGSGVVNGIAYELNRGDDEIAGNNAANSGYTYGVNGDYSLGVLSQVGEDGGDGGWAVLYGADPLPTDQIVLAVDEEVVARDTTRNHTKEIVDYWVFATAELTLQKKVINDDGGTATESDFKLGASGVSSISGFSGDEEITDATVAPGAYTLGEGGPSGYTGTWSCTGATLTGTTLTLNTDDDAVCTLVNDDIFVPPKVATLTLEKKVVNDGGGSAGSTDFTLQFDDGAGASGSGVQGDSAITAVVVPPGLYKLDESAFPGYQLVEISCNGLDADGSDGVKLGAGENVICTFVNDDQGVDLEVKKSVSDPSPNVGDTVTFSIVVFNNGPDTATDLRVTDIIKPGFSYIANSISGGSTRDDTFPDTTGLDWTIATLPSGADETLTFQATVSSP